MNAKLSSGGGDVAAGRGKGRFDGESLKIVDQLVLGLGER